MDLQLKDKVVLITGGAKGIGAAIARGCAREGAIPVFVDKDADAAKQLHEELSTRGAKSSAISTDVVPAENCAAVVEQTVGEFGGLDVLVNNVGVTDKVGLEHGSPEKYLKSLELNLLHYYNMAHYDLPALQKSQGAILSLTRDWACELLPYGMRVNAIVPAEVMTPLYKWWLNTFPNPEEKLKHIVSKIPLGKRMTQPEEIAAMALFLISPQASHVTGQHVLVDGGYVHLDRALT